MAGGFMTLEASQALHAQMMADTGPFLSNLEFLGFDEKSLPKDKPKTGLFATAKPLSQHTRKPREDGTFRIKADDIKHQNVLTDDQIASIPVEKVFEWVKTGQWKQKDFRRWLRAMRVIE
jgi:hypothetical protein